MLVLGVMDSRKKQIFEPRFNIVLLDVDDYKATKVNYNCKFIREMKVKVNE